MATQTTAIVSLDELRRELVQVPPIVAQAQGMTVATVEDYEMAAVLMQRIAQGRQLNWDRVTKVVQINHAAWKEAVSLRDDAVRGWDVAKEIMNGKLRVYDAEQERVRRAEEARLAAIAKEERDRLALEQAAALEKSGDKALAEMVLEQAADAPPPVVVLESATPKVTEMAGRTNWFFEVTDEKLVPREFMSPDEKKIGAVVRSQKGLTQIPGVRVWSEKNFHGRK